MSIGFVRFQPTLVTHGLDAFAQSLVHFDGADAATTLTDVGAAGATWTVTGNAQLDTAIVKFGTAAGLFDGTGDAWRTPSAAWMDIGTGEFTAEIWFNRAGGNGTIRRMFTRLDTGGVGEPGIWGAGLNASNVCSAFFTDSTNTQRDLAGTTAFTATGWNHVAICVDRTGTPTLRLYVNGVEEASTTTFDNDLSAASADLAIGIAGETSAQPWNGSLDEFRVSNVCRYRNGATFTPPAVAFS